MDQPKPKLPELLAPAGNPERLRTALHYGADAVYVGLKAMSLRNYADNFTPAELKEACALAHSMGRRVYVTLNAFARDEDLQALPQLLEAARSGYMAECSLEEGEQRAPFTGAVCRPGPAAGGGAGDHSLV